MRRAERKQADPADLVGLAADGKLRGRRVVLGADDLEGLDDGGNPLKTPEKLASLVRSVRKDAGMTQVEMGRRCSTGQSRISSIENGSVRLSIDLLVRMAAADGKKVVISIQ